MSLVKKFCVFILCRFFCRDCFYKSNYPVIFIITDASDKGNNLGQKLFPDTVQMKYRIANISFNTCALTLMKMALKRATALVLENSDIFKLPSQSTVDAIMNTAMGDIRSAVNQYYMASLLGNILFNILKIIFIVKKHNQIRTL